MCGPKEIVYYGRLCKILKPEFIIGANSIALPSFMLRRIFGIIQAKNVSEKPYKNPSEFRESNQIGPPCTWGIQSGPFAAC